MTERNSSFSAIILAGGKGERTNLSTPKQFLEIDGKKVIEYSLEKFLEFTDEVIVVVPSIEDWENQNIDLPVEVAQGGKTRTESLLSGLKLATKPYTLLHDASRPIIPDEVIDNIVSSLQEYKCVYPVLPVKNSLVIDEDGKLKETPDRSTIRKIQTPQGFHTDILKQALEQFGEQHVHIPELVRLLGHEVLHIEGSSWLFKITYEPDVYAAKHYLEEYQSLNQELSE